MLMKRFLILIPIIPLAIFGFLIYKNINTTPQKSEASTQVLSSDQNQNSIKFDFNDQNISVVWYKIDNSEKLILIPNFSEKLTSKEIIDKNNCQFLSSAGFYNKDDSPIGLVIADSKLVNSWQENSLFDGILSVNQMATPRITRQIPQDQLLIATQVGPILKENAQVQTLRIQNDNPSRRTVAAITGENVLYFLSFYDTNSNYSGPLLANLPNILQTFENKTRITFADAINLDGGSASAFHSPSINLIEASPVGAFFCLL